MTVLRSVIVALSAAAASATPKVHFREDGTLTIVQFTDLHMEAVWHPPSVKETVSVLESILTHEEPDFVAYTGDVCEVSSSSCRLKANQTAIFHAAFGPVERRGIPWGLTFGNWDRFPDANMTGPEITSFLGQTFKYNVNKQPPEYVRGDSVFDVPILLPDQSIGGVLYFLDTHMNDGCEGTSGTGCIYPSEVAWYNATSRAYRASNGGKALEGMAFFHIPLPEHMAVWNNGPSTYGRLDETAGPKGLGVSCVIDSNGFFNAAVANGDIKAMTCGHDHDNDFHGTLHGIEMMYGRKTGFGSYGPPKEWGSYPAKDGARVIQLQRDAATGSISIKTWIRLMDGTRLSQEQEGKHTPGENRQTTCNSVSLADAIRHHCPVSEPAIVV